MASHKARQSTHNKKKYDAYRNSGRKEINRQRKAETYRKKCEKRFKKNAA